MYNTDNAPKWYRLRPGQPALFCIFAMLVLLTIDNLSAQPAADSIQTGQLTQLKHNFAFTEGPVSDDSGNVYFTDQPNNAIWKYDIEDRFSIFMQPAGRANGMIIDAEGDLFACADLRNQLWKIDIKSKKVDTLLTGYQGKLLNGPNDLWMDENGGIFFTDPYYQRDYWARKETQQDKPCVYYLPKNATKAIRVSDLLVKPNGIVGSADGRHLFVADIEGKKIYRFDIGNGGRLSNPFVILHHVADGITIDQKGHLYLSGNGVTVINAQGRIIKYIPVDEPWVSNLCFGGKNHNILFITASTHLYKISTNQNGVQP
ncbi:SMP-30/gluconolactonase/LRE family protein [Arachidicoccus terrestris]|uniref:SMP-30/gluconolactonase/LRE family protein n=1 Tax=Arachidicoccus terrestris TaxID=2875539 RepID=UPI001CC52ECC|nr:SMP-30/gluconolactonase/LRE family protein [Arachidicoccus terrestris]UAY57146.1 SMP-30/gluconolactonase/LRE family protein [Arachidicoccus terrestris]